MLRLMTYSTWKPYGKKLLTRENLLEVSVELRPTNGPSVHVSEFVVYLSLHSGL